MEDYIKITLNSALYNAGVLGVIKFLETAGAEENSDYRFEGQDLFIKREFLLNADLAEIYLNTMIKIFGEKSIVSDFIKTDFNNLEAETAEDSVKSENSEEAENSEDKNGSSENENSEKTKVQVKKEIKPIDRLNRFNKYFSGNTYKTVCNNLEITEVITLGESFSKLQKEEAFEEKKGLALNLQKIIIENPKLYRYMLIADIAMKQFPEYFSSFAFLKYNGSIKGNYIEKKVDFIDSLNEKFFDILKQYLNLKKDNKIKKTSMICIECGASDIDGMEMTFLNDIVDDMGKKKSVFWNKQPDSYVCPVCALVYACVPFGFFEAGKDRLFVNHNKNIKNLVSFNTTVANQKEEDNSLRVINAMVLNDLLFKTEELTGLEVLIREYNPKRSFYSFKILGADVLKTIKVSAKQLEALKKIFVKVAEKDYINIFNECVNNILLHRNQWNLIFQMVKGEKLSIYILEQLLTVQVNQNHIKEENLMEASKRVYAARFAGRDLRKLTGEDADNKLRGYVYKLVNALGSGNKELFLNTVVRMYGGMNMPIPDTLINLFGDDESFKETGYAYIFGLKGSDENYKSNTVNKEESKNV